MKGFVLTILLFSMVAGVATNVGTIEVNGAYNESGFVGEAVATITDSDFMRNMQAQMDMMTNSIEFDMSKVFDYEALVNTVAISLHNQGMIPDITGDIWALGDAVSFIENMPVK